MRWLSLFFGKDSLVAFDAPFGSFFLPSFGFRLVAATVRYDFDPEVWSGSS